MNTIKFISKLFFILVLILTACTTTRIQKMETTPKISIIPKPLELKQNNGSFSINSETKILSNQNHPELIKIGEYLAENLNTSTGFNLKVEPGSNSSDLPNSIFLQLNKNQDDLGDEGYELLVSTQSVIVRADNAAGLFYGVQTIRQLLPTEIEGSEKNGGLIIPGTHIVDQPRFSWRGMLLDCGRHFMTKDFVKRYIDLLAYHKMNRLHWHLTEDQGWRIEIKKYPKLTEIGAWRKYEDGTVYGGFYTQEDIKEMVEYAKSRYVTVIPEIELPGHSVAALAAYPRYSCTAGHFEVSTRWGVHKEVYCAGNDETFKFLEDILSEVIELFPAPYIHIGGDECPKVRWENCEKCQARIKAENLKDEHELQSYFIKRIEKFLLTKNRRIIGWDEILEGGLAPEATVQSWRGMDGAIAAATSGHDAIVSPTSHAYFDYPIERTDLRKVYSFEPVPPGLSGDQAKHILGGECNIWTEYAPQEIIDRKTFPRILAMSEVLWSPREGRNYPEFHKRVRTHYKRLDLLGVDYGPESRPISMLPAFDATKNEFKITLESGENELSIFYTLDGSNPTMRSRRYKKPFTLKKSVLVKAAAFRDGQPYGEISEKQFIIHLASGKPAKLKYAYNQKYTGGGTLGLTDGITGSVNFRDGFWQGFEQDDLEAVIDLGTPVLVRRIIVRFLQHAGAWIFYPRSVAFAVSEDGENFQAIDTIENDFPTDHPDPVVKEFKVKFDPIKARYVKVFAKNIGVCPPKHPSAGGKAWVFVDEIVIR